MALPFLKNFKVGAESVKKASEWFKQKIRDLHLQTIPHGVGLTTTTVPLPGHMFLYHYDAKFKDELPYWDTYPLVLPFNVKSDRFWGLNLHYLPPEYRLMLLGALNKLVVDSKISNQKRMEMSWHILSESTRLNYIKPCVHQYLLTGNHVKSKLLLIDSEEWYNAVLLPLEAFKGKNKDGKFVNVDKRRVWNDSLR